MVNSTEINELLLAPRLLTFDEDMNDYRKRFRAFVLENIKPKLSLWELKGKVDKECFQKAAQLGFYCQNIPKTFGGAGLTDFRYVRLSQVLVFNLLFNFTSINPAICHSTS